MALPQNPIGLADSTPANPPAGVVNDKKPPRTKASWIMVKSFWDGYAFSLEKLPSLIPSDCDLSLAQITDYESSHFHET
jgi:hypothetical protein